MAGIGLDIAEVICIGYGMIILGVVSFVTLRCFYRRLFKKTKTNGNWEG